MGSFLDALVYVGKVRAESGDGVQDGCAVWTIEGFDGFGVEVFDCLLVASADAVSGTRISVKGVYGLGDSHLRRSHGCGY